MAATTKGTAHLFGIQAGVGSVTNATVENYTRDEQHANTAETVNEDGNKIEDRRDDLRKTGSITLRVRAAFTKPAPGQYWSYDGESHFITKTGQAESSGGFVQVTCDYEIWEYISAS